MSLYDGDSHDWLSGPDSTASANSVAFSYTLVLGITLKANTPYIVAISQDSLTGTTSRARRTR